MMYENADKAITAISNLLKHRAFGEDVGSSDSHSDFLLHLTRLIDRTTDLYSFRPVVPLTSKTVQREGNIRVTLIAEKRRFRQQSFDATNWTTLIDEAKAIEGKFPGADTELGNALINHFRKNAFELDWAERLSPPYQLTEPSIGLDMNEWKRVVRVGVERAIDRGRQNFPGRNIVIFPEFGFPPLLDPAERLSFINEIRSEYIDAYKHKIDTARDFIFLGSYHDPLTAQNLGVAFPFGITPYRSGMSSSRQRQSLAGIYYQRKRHASKKLGEVLAPVENLEFPVFVTDMGRIAILICSDIYDLSLFLGMVRYNLRCLPGGEIDYVFVPSYNRSRKLIETCRQLSFLMNNVVVYVTSFRLGEPAKNSDDFHYFVCGRDETRIKEAEEHLGEGGPLITESSKEGGTLTFTLNPERVALLRLLTRKKYSKAIRQAGRRTHYLGRYPPKSAESVDEAI